MPLNYHPFQPTLRAAGLEKYRLTLQWALPDYRLMGTIYRLLQIRCQGPSPYPILPDGTQALYLSRSGISLGGTLTQAQEIPLLYPGDYFGVWFYPACLRHFLPFNQAECARQIIDNRALGAPALNALHQRVYNERSFAARVSACNAWLRSNFQAKPIAKLDTALSFIYRSRGSEAIKHLAQHTGWSSRHLNRQFLQHTGLSTKAFCNVIRAQAVCKQLCQANSSSALSHNYFDQAHLIKEFKKHFKLSPSQFIANLNATRQN